MRSLQGHEEPGYPGVRRRRKMRRYQVRQGCRLVQEKNGFALKIKRSPFCIHAGSGSLFGRGLLRPDGIVCEATFFCSALSSTAWAMR